MDGKPLQRLIEVARGDRPADLRICNARLVNVFTGTVERTDIAVVDGYIAALGTYEAACVVDLEDRYVAPGLIDAHVHVESAMLGPAGFARAVLPRGTTTVVADPHEIANVLGTDGIEYMLAESRHQPLNFFFSLPSCVPATDMENAGARLNAAVLEAYVHHPRIVALAEMMNFPGVVFADAEVISKIRAMQKGGKPVDGHAPGLGGGRLQAYLAAGIGSDHECTTLAEAREKLASGMHIMVREGTGARNLDALLPLVSARNARRMMWCTDDRHPHDLLAEGHIDSMVRRAVKAGLDPITAIQMATLNVADYFRLTDVGAVAPGRRADLVVLDDLNDPVVRQVYCAGRLTAQEGRMIDAEPARVQTGAGTLNLSPGGLQFRIEARGRRMRVIAALADQIVTESEQADATIVDGFAEADPARDMLKIAVIERHHGSGAMGLGFIRGFGLKNGALAGTVAHDSHNIIVLGDNDRDMRIAVAALVDMGGGLAAVENGRVTACLALPVAGLMSNLPIAQVCRHLDELLAAARRLGSALPDPFMTMSFMALPVIPALKITDQGLVDVQAFKMVPLFIDES
jgi:adenine deaminase